MIHVKLQSRTLRGDQPAVSLKTLAVEERFPIREHDASGLYRKAHVTGSSDASDHPLTGRRRFYHAF